MENTRDLFRKIRDTKGTFHAKMSTIKDRKTIEKLYKKVLNDPDNHNGMYTHLEPEILECIMMNKASGGDGIPAELYLKS